MSIIISQLVIIRMHPVVWGGRSLINVMDAYFANELGLNQNGFYLFIETGPSMLLGHRSGKTTQANYCSFGAALVEEEIQK